MLRSLRARLVLSHVALLLITVPLMGVALVYVLETGVVLANLSRQITGQAVLVAEMAREHPEIWDDVAAARLCRPGRAAVFCPVDAPFDR